MSSSVQNKANANIVLWLIICALLVTSMIMLGGATRLTESGLSITEWKPLSGIIPPLNSADWLREFEHYKAFPEYQLKHMDIDLAGFKFIFWMEYSHRLLGRILGLFFILPIFFFWKNLSGTHRKRMIFMAVLLAAQGFMGWFMVKSGLVNNPYVSHYRLAAHLSLALILLCFFLWTIFDFTEVKNKVSLATLKGPLHGLLMLIFLTIIYGAFVAGLRAGKLYNTFPLMGGQWIPWEWSYLSPIYKNFFENPVTVQLIHRILGIVTFCYTTYIAVKIWFLRDRLSALILFFAVLLQVKLGVMTLIYIVPVSLALMHQLGAVVLLSISLNFFYRSKH